MKIKQLFLLSCVAFLAACASKVPLTDLPSVVDRTATDQSMDGKNASGTTGTGSNAANNGLGISTPGGGASSTAISTVDAGTNNVTQPDAGMLAKRSIYFDYDSFAIRDDAKAILQAHAKNLSNKRSSKIALEGHTDERGGGEYNLALGQKRANAVQEALQLLGVLPSQMEAVSFGKEKPKSTGASEEGYAENRRADIQYK